MDNRIPNLYETKKERIRILFFTLKLLALFFSTIPLYQYFAYKIDLDYSYYIIIINGITLLITGIVFFILIFIFTKSGKYRILQLFEVLIFLGAFISIIYISGANDSYYKFIFLFIIISYTIEFGMKIGFIIATISTGVIVTMDLYFGGFKGVNKSFEDDLPLFAMFFLIVAIMGYYSNLEKAHIREITDFANRDGLTGAYNHRYFHEIMDKYCNDSKEKGTDLSLIIIDLDYFKKYNDFFGHKKGDDLLKEIATIIRNNIKTGDILCRYGGDEFCIILPDTNQKDASDLANEIRLKVYNNEWLGQEYLPDRKMSISVGVTTFNDSIENCTDFIESADRAMYRAKFLRRNKVEIYSSVFDQISESDFSNGNNGNIAESLKTFKTLIVVINSRDSYTYNHVDRVYNYCSIIADYLKLSANDKKTLLYASYLHDLGKINISKEILIADNMLTNEQWNELKKHPLDGSDILKQIDGFERVSEVVLQHHEKYDGSGYPYGIKGGEINYLARILTVVDSFDAMTNHRTYQKIKTFEEAFEEIENCKGTHFDPDIADKFIEAIKVI